MEKFYQSFIKELIKEVFIASSLSFIVLLSLEIIKPGLVSAYISLNFWLLFWVVSAILIISVKK